ncbi:MAG: DUF4037 domain-containing protein [Anaerolineaceae bacterium]|nr:DUF4037 domain-containing protein [Anaerolineaceae bacterium]
METLLPPDASPHSQSLFEYALILISACPAALYDEAAVSGSVARGRADQFSDCEIPFWMDTLQNAIIYKTWLESFSQGALLMRESTEADKALYLEYKMDGVKVCTIWQTWGRMNEIFTALDANQLPHDPSGPWVISHLIPIGSAPRLQQLQTRVQNYPDTLRRSIIEKELAFWRWKVGVADIFFAEAAAHRHQLYDLRTRQMTNIRSILQILYAYNRQWIPDAKWYNEGIQAVTQKPPHLSQTIDRLLTEDDPHIILPTMRELMVGTLHVIAEEFAVDDLITALEGYTFIDL